ncbi:MAG TPA: hypothetical protein VLM85_10760 [Polyangiaceae bacterium]|nr:hypothetical protein [Polyangiaceae bacterium]
MSSRSAHLAALLACSVTVATSSARADDDVAASAPVVAQAPSIRVRFTSPATPPSVAEAACALVAVNPIGGQARAFDVYTGEHRCSSLPADQGAIALHVRTESREDSRTSVVLEADDTPGIATDDLRAAVAQTAQELRDRLSGRPPRTVPVETTPATRMASPGLRGFGVAFAIMGGVVMSAGAVVGIGALFVAAVKSGVCGIGSAVVGSNGGGCGSDASGGATAALVMISVGAAFLTTGAIAISIGGRHVAQVSAYAAPTGGGVRVVF